MSSSRRFAAGFSCLALATAFAAGAAARSISGRWPPTQRPAPSTGAIAAGPIERMPLDVRAVAREAYVWGWPLAYVHQCRRVLEKVPVTGRSGGMPVAPLNRLSMLVDTIADPSTVIPCPNQDVIYGFGVFDLAASPVVIQVPDFGSRVWLYQLGDQRTDSFADVGCMHGTRPGAYLVAGRDWNGAVPPGIAGVFRCPTRYAVCLPRVFVTAEPGDREAALPAVNRVLAYPLAEFNGELRDTDWSRARWVPAVARRVRRFRRAGGGGGVTAADLLDALPGLLADVPPLPGEEPLYARLRSLVAAVERDPAARAAAIAGAEEADREVVAPLFEFRNFGRRLPGNWTTLDNGGAFGTDYLTRTAVARSNVFVNRACETRYYYLDLDASGLRLDGDCDYVITFPPGGLPPARGFWSLTVYDERHGLSGDSPGRRAIGSRNPGLACGPDGSLTVLLCRAGGSIRRPPAEAEQANHLETPAGKFSLLLRIYWPDDAAIEAGWTPPEVRVKPSLPRISNSDTLLNAATAP